MYSIIFAMFHFTFVGFAIFWLGSVYEVIYFLILTVAVAAALRQQFQITIRSHYLTRDDFRIFLGLSGLVITVFVITYYQYGLPIFSQNPEIQRVVISEQLGRLPLIAVFILCAYGMFLVMMARTWAVKLQHQF